MAAIRTALRRLLAPPAIRSIGRIRLRPGDALLIRVDDDLSEDQFAQIEHRVKPYFPDNLLIVLSGDSDVQVVDSASHRPVAITVNLDGQVLAESITRAACDERASA